MPGAIAGDVVGSVYEWSNHKSNRFDPLFAEDAFFTDDTVHTVAVMAALMNGGDFGAYRREIRERLGKDFGYDLGRSVDEIRPGSRFDETCQGSVPEALICALEAESIKDAIRNAISIGGDSDTIAAVAGSVAQGLWGVPESIQAETTIRLDGKLRNVVPRFWGGGGKETQQTFYRTTLAQPENRHMVPRYDEMVRATLASLRKRGGVATNQEIEDDIVAGMNLSEEAAAELHGNGPQTRVGYNAGWTRTWLRKIGAIEPAAGPKTRRGVWTLTAKGRDVDWAESRAETEMKAAVRHYQEEAKQKKKGQESAGTTRAKAEQSAPASPETDDDSAEDSWKADLMEVLLQLDPAAFERLCRWLLHATGIEDLVVKGGPGDGGIDGTGWLKVGLVSFQVAFQAKRWSGTVGPAVVREMQGSMTSDVNHGIVITTGHFSPSAKTQAKAPGAKQVELVDGERLCELLDEHGLGVKKIERREVDREWLEKM